MSDGNRRATNCGRQPRAVSLQSGAPRLRGTSRQSSAPARASRVCSQKQPAYVAGCTHPSFIAGCTAFSPSSIAVNRNDGVIAYPAGGVVVFYSPATHKQVLLVSNTNSISSVTFSNCGAYFALGECGHEPRVKVFELTAAGDELKFREVVVHKSHAFSVVAVRFSHDARLIASMGHELDGCLHIFSVQTGEKVTHARVPYMVNAMAASLESSVFVTAGSKHVRFWHLVACTGSAVMMLKSASPHLGDYRSNEFCDVCCAPNGCAFAITRRNTMFEFHNEEFVRTYELVGERESARSLAYGFNEVFIGFGNTIRVFDLGTHTVRRTLCKPHDLLQKMPGATPIRPSPSKALLKKAANFPGVSGLCFSQSTGTLAAVCSGQSVYVWQLAGDPASVSLLSAQLFHLGAVNCIQMYPPESEFLRRGTIISGGADGTVRFWNFTEGTGQLQPGNRGVFCGHLEKIVYLMVNNTTITKRAEDAPHARTSDSLLGVRSLAASPDGAHLAVGCKDGNVRVLDLSAAAVPQLFTQEAHTGEVMCLQYSSPEAGRYLLASGGRDRLIHVYDVADRYRPLTTVDDCCSTVESLAFGRQLDDLTLVSGTSDKQIFTRRMVKNIDQVRFARGVSLLSNLGQDCALLTNGVIVMACQDRQLRYFAAESGKLTRVVRISESKDGQFVKVRASPSEKQVAVVGTDRKVFVVDVATGVCAAILTGHFQILTDVQFCSNSKGVVAASQGGCIIVWKLAEDAARRA